MNGCGEWMSGWMKVESGWCGGWIDGLVGGWVWRMHGCRYGWMWIDVEDGWMSE